MTTLDTKPNSGTVPTWATDSSTRVAASSGQQASGWTNGQRPAFNVMNWLQGLFADFIAWCVGAIDDLNAGKLENTTDTLTGDLTVTGAVGAATLSVPVVTSNLVPNATGQDLGSSGSRWDAFLRDVDATGNITADGALGVGLDALFSGKIVMTAAADPAKTAAHKHDLFSANICKAWGTFKVSAAGGLSGSDGIYDGFNVSSATLVTNTLSVFFAQDFPDDKYCVVISSSLPGVFHETSRAVGGVGVQAKDFAGAAIDLTAVGVEYFVSVQVFGRQT